MKYVDVIIDNKSKETDCFYTYACPFDDVREGQKAYAPFGKGGKLREVYVFQVKDSLEKDIKGIKEIESLDPEIVLNREMLDTILFMKRRYLCKTIDAVKCFTPAGSSSKRGKKRVPYADEKGENASIEKLTDEQQHAIDEIVPCIKENQNK